MLLHAKFMQENVHASLKCRRLVPENPIPNADLRRGVAPRRRCSATGTAPRAPRLGRVHATGLNGGESTLLQANDHFIVAALPAGPKLGRGNHVNLGRASRVNPGRASPELGAKRSFGRAFVRAAEELILLRPHGPTRATQGHVGSNNLDEDNAHNASIIFSARSLPSMRLSHINTSNSEPHGPLLSRSAFFSASSYSGYTNSAHGGVSSARIVSSP